MRRPAATITAWQVNSLQYQVISSYRLSPWFLLQTATATATSIVGKGNKHHCSQSLHIIPTYTIPSSKLIHLENPQSSKENNPQMLGFHGFSIYLRSFTTHYNVVCFRMARMMRLFLASPPRNEASRAFAHSKQRTPSALNEGLGGQPGDPEGCTFSDKPIP